MNEWLHKFGVISGILGLILAAIVAYGNKEFRCFYGLGLKSDECPNAISPTTKGKDDGF